MREKELSLTKIAKAAGVAPRTLYEWRRTRKQLFNVIKEWYVHIYLPKTLKGS